MSFKKTIIIFVIFAAAATAYYFDQKRVGKKTAREESESRLVTPAQTDITDLTIAAGTQAATLKKQGSTWTITSPVKDRADRSTVDAILGEIDRAKKKEPFEITEAKLDEYGLKNPAVRADVQASGKNYILRFALGSDTPDNTETYARIGDEKKIFTIPNTVKPQLIKTPLDLRDKRPIPASAVEATSMTLESTQTLQVAKRNEQWQLVSPVQGKADASKVTEILNELNNAKRSDFVDTTTTDLAQYGLDNPQLKISLYVAGSDPASSATLRTLQVGKMLPNDPTKHYAQLMGEPTIFAVPESLLTKGKPGIDDLRAKEIFSIHATDVGRATFKVRGSALTLERDSAGQWHFAGDKVTRLDQAEVSNKINTLLNLKAKSFLQAAPPADKSGLSDPNLRVTVSNKAGTTTESLITGRKAETEDIVYAQVPATGQYLALDWKEPGQFFVMRDDLLDKTLFNFSEDAAQKMDITEDSHTLTLTKTASGAWEGNAGGKTLQVEGPKMTALLYGLTSLAWARRLDPKVQSDMNEINTQKLKSPPREVVIYDKEGKEAARLGLGGEELKYAYARKGKDEYVAIDKMRLASLTDAINGVTGKSPPSKPAGGMPNMPMGMPPPSAEE